LIEKLLAGQTHGHITQVYEDTAHLSSLIKLKM